MSWLAVNKVKIGFGKYRMEMIFHNRPVKNKEGIWVDEVYYDEYRSVSSSADDGSIEVPNGTIKAITGIDMNENSKPIELKCIKTLYNE